MNNDLAAEYSPRDIMASAEMHRSATREKSQNWRRWPGQFTDPIEQEIAYRAYKEIDGSRRPEGEWNDTVSEFRPTERERGTDSSLQGWWSSFKPGRTTNHIWDLVLRGLKGEDVPPDVAAVVTKAQKWREAMLIEHVDKIAQAERLLRSKAVKEAAEAEQRAYEKSDDYKRAKLNEEIERCKHRANQLASRLKRWNRKLKAAQRKLTRLNEKSK